MSFIYALADPDTKALMSAAHKKRLEDPAEREILRQRSLKYGNEPPHKKGSEVPNAVFTEEIVIRIRREIRAGDKNTIANLAKEFGVSYQAVHLAATGKSWAHVDEPFVQMNPAKKLTEEDIREIRILLKEGNLKQIEIAKRFNVDQSHISNIKNNKRLNTARRSLK